MIIHTARVFFIQETSFGSHLVTFSPFVSLVTCFSNDKGVDRHGGGGGAGAGGGGKAEAGGGGGARGCESDTFLSLSIILFSLGLAESSRYF